VNHARGFIIGRKARKPWVGGLEICIDDASAGKATQDVPEDIDSRKTEIVGS
jgi:hypothetical protein